MPWNDRVTCLHGVGLQVINQSFCHSFYFLTMSVDKERQDLSSVLAQHLHPFPKMLALRSSNRNIHVWKQTLPTKVEIPEKSPERFPVLGLELNWYESFYFWEMTRASKICGRVKRLPLKTCVSHISMGREEKGAYDWGRKDRLRSSKSRDRIRVKSRTHNRAPRQLLKNPPPTPYKHKTE